MGRARDLARFQPSASGLVEANDLAAGAAVSNLGYTPVNKAGDTMSGTLEVQAGWRLGTNTGGSGGGAPYAGGLGGGFNPNNNVYSMYCRDRTDTHWNDLWIETKTLALKTNGGNTAIYMDQSGRVLMPYQPAFWSWRSGGGNVGSEEDFQCDQVQINRGSHYNTSNFRFTAPVTGAYCFEFHAMNNQGNPGSSTVYFWINGAKYHYFHIVNSHPSSAGSTVILQLSANDYVNCTASNIHYNGGSQYKYPHFGGYLIG